MKRFIIGLAMAFAFVFVGNPSSADSIDLVGKLYVPPLSQELSKAYGPVQILGTDNKYSFCYFEEGDFTITILLRSKTIVDIQDGKK